MTRRLCLALAVLAGLASALLVGWSPTAHYQGETTTCDTVIVAAACHDERVEVTALAGLGVLLCVAFGSVVVLGGRPAPIASPRGGRIAPTSTC